MLALVHLADLDPRRGAPLSSLNVSLSILFRFDTSVSASAPQINKTGDAITKPTTGDDFLGDDVFFGDKYSLGETKFLEGNKYSLRESEFFMREKGNIL